MKKYCAEKHIEVVGRVSFSPLINKTLREGQLLLETIPDSEPVFQIREAGDNLLRMIE